MTTHLVRDSGGHLDDQALSSVLDGEATEEQVGHAAACAVCAGRLSALAELRTLLAEQPAAAPAAARERAVAAAVSSAAPGQPAGFRGLRRPSAVREAQKPWQSLLQLPALARHRLRPARLAHHSLPPASQGPALSRHRLRPARLAPALAAGAVALAAVAAVAIGLEATSSGPHPPSASSAAGASASTRGPSAPHRQSLAGPLPAGEGGRLSRSGREGYLGSFSGTQALVPALEAALRGSTSYGASSRPSGSLPASKAATSERAPSCEAQAAVAAGAAVPRTALLAERLELEGKPAQVFVFRTSRAETGVVVEEGTCSVLAVVRL